MNRCPTCGSLEIFEQRCRDCGFAPGRVSGFVAYAPELAFVGAGYAPEHFEALASLETGHFWFEARNTLILHAFRRHFARAENYLEVGCGTGFVLKVVSEAFPALTVSGSEVFAEGLRCAALRNPRVELFQMDATRMPFAAAFDVIAAFDVLEHIEDDAAVAAELYRATKPGGGALLTVPQHPWLWSQQDEAAHHFRRYRAGQLEALLTRAGFQVVESQSFSSLLLPAMVAARFPLFGEPSEDPYREFRLPHWLNGALKRILRLELSLIEHGLRFPIGGSRLVVARKARAHERDKT